MCIQCNAVQYSIMKRHMETYIRKHYIKFKKDINIKYGKGISILLKVS